MFEGHEQLQPPGSSLSCWPCQFQNQADEFYRNSPQQEQNKLVFNHLAMHNRIQEAHSQMQRPSMTDHANIQIHNGPSQEHRKNFTAASYQARDATSVTIGVNGVLTVCVSHPFERTEFNQKADVSVH